MFFTQDNVSTILLNNKDYNIHSIPFSGKASDWEQYYDFVPKEGDMIIFTPDAEEENYRIKIGNGITPLGELEFISLSGSGGGGSENGFSPIATVEQTTNGAVISITDKDGTTTATITNGENGASITVKSVSESTKDDGNNVVTFSDGKTVTIKNGSKGSTGAPGYTPVKGVDYYTAGDRADFRESLATELASTQADVVELNARVDNLATLQNGSTTGDAELIQIRTGFRGDKFDNAGNAVREQARMLFNKTNTMSATVEKNAHLERVSNGHFYKLHTDASSLMDMWIVNENGETVKGSATTDPKLPQQEGSDFIRCPKYLCINFTDTASTFYIYFYDLVDGEYIPRWDIVNETTTSRKKNYMERSTVLSKFGNMIEIPDGVYMQVCSVYGDVVEFYGWDGISFGMPLSSDVCFPTRAAGAGTLNTDGRFGITIPGDAEFITTNDCVISILNAYKGTAETNILSSRSKFISLPKGYDYFRVCVYLNNGTVDLKKTITGDVSKYISVVVPTRTEEPSGRALRVLENCRRINSVVWTPAATFRTKGIPKRDEDGNITAYDNSGSIFKAGVEYNGFPYGSSYSVAHYIGWHVSPHTFINAVNDSESIIYKERLWNDDGESAPYYGVVCSVFASLCAGLPYPLATGGHYFDPNSYAYFTEKPPIGSMFDNLGHLASGGHVVVPERVDYMENGVAISAYESVVPLSQRTTRYSIVPDNSNLIGTHTTSSGAHYYDTYGWAVYNHLANPDQSASFDNIGKPDDKDKNTGRYVRNVPYLGMTEDDLMVIGGGARPYKGDKSVYTSAEQKVAWTEPDDNGLRHPNGFEPYEEGKGVLINIKDTNATQLKLRKDNSTSTININGATQIDVKQYLSGDGIYYVSTNTNPIEESFEYVTVEPITYIMENGVPKVSSKNFWYITFGIRDNSFFKGQRPVAQLPADDYSYLIKNGAKINRIVSIYGRGKYGAYIFPVEEVS